MKKVRVNILSIIAAAGLTLALASCSSTPKAQIDPDERIDSIHTLLKKHRYEEAIEILNGLKFTIAGNIRDEEIKYLTALTYFKQGKFLESDPAFGLYLAGYPDGRFAQEALYYQASSKIRQSQRSVLGLFSVRKVLPIDRDVSFIREARDLFSLYTRKYPKGEFIEEAAAREAELRSKVGEHELEIASYYLRKNNPDAAILRVERIIEEDHPKDIKERAVKLLKQARSSKGP